MLLGLEIGMLVAGILALVRGKLTIIKPNVVEGGPARLIGLLFLAPVPLQIMAGFMIGLKAASSGTPAPTGMEPSLILTRLLIDGFCGGLAVALGFACAHRPDSSRAFHDDSYGYSDRSARPESWESPPGARYEDIPPAGDEELDDDDPPDRDPRFDRPRVVETGTDIQKEPRRWISPPAGNSPGSAPPLQPYHDPLMDRPIKPPPTTSVSSLTWLGGMCVVVAVLGFVFWSLNSTANSLIPKYSTAPAFRPVPGKLQKGFQ